MKKIKNKVWGVIESLVVFVLKVIKTKYLDKKDPSPLDFLKVDAARDGYDTFSKNMSGSMIFQTRPDMRSFVIRESLKLLNGSVKVKKPLFLEFGVAGATSINHFATLLSKSDVKIYGFDAFLGLEEDWLGMHRGRTAGAYSYQGNLPNVSKNVELIVGWLQETLVDFLDKHKTGTIVFAHFDMDTYSPGRYGLEKIKPFLRKGSILLFDDFYAYPGWRNNDFKSLNELFTDKEYEFIAFSHTEAAIRIL